MTLEDWRDPKNHCLGMLIHGEASDDMDERGRPNRGQTLYLLLNAGTRARHFDVPRLNAPGHWMEVLNTSHATGRPEHRVPLKGLNVAAHSLVLLCYVED